MCGIIAVLRRPSGRSAPPAAAILEALDQVVGILGQAADDLSPAASQTLAEAAATLNAVDRSLMGTAGLACLLSSPGLSVAEAVAVRATDLQRRVAHIEARLDGADLPLSPSELETVNGWLIAVKDAVWAIGTDRVRMARAVADLAWGAGLPDLDGELPLAALDALWAVQVALSALDRLEVRGRDSAGLHPLISGHGLDWQDPDIGALLAPRVADPLFTSMGVRTPAGQLSLVYKAAAEIGELGDNSRALRAAIRSDLLLHRALANSDAHCTVLGHTRWASVGVISQANAHPLNSEELDRIGGPYVVAALNGDVDNYLDLRTNEGLRVPPEVTTDAKVIPTVVSRRVHEGMPLIDAFRTSVARFEGSVAIGVSAAQSPDQLHLALRGSGQSLHVGLAEDAFVVASEPYGLVEETPTYLRLDGETTHGQIVVLDRAHAGTLDGLHRMGYDGSELPVEFPELRTAEITTRDIDRAGYPHFLLKEISEAPQSFRKTLRGKVKVPGTNGHLAVQLSDEALPDALVARLRSGETTRIFVIGQGTAAVAGQSVAASLSSCLARAPISVTCLLATELSGFAMTDDMSDTLVIAVSQSGTTTDTNRTVDLVRARGAHVISIVNRRNSDLVEKSDGVLYTSDGRDVEMSVASTKAFYAQVAAGFLLAIALAEHLGCNDRRQTDLLLAGMRQLPDAMEQVLARRDEIADAAARQAPGRRYWAVVGNGPNHIAASEIRIKLSELCYKSIACDGTEDKKHIDLSSEPLILVCAAGLAGPTADDVAKEVTIYRAHKAAPVVITTEGQGERFGAALHTIEVPVVHPQLAFVLSAMVGHLFGYEAALSIDAQARPLREARAAVEDAVTRAATTSDPAQLNGDRMLAELRPALQAAARPFFEGLRAGAYNGHLEAATAVRLDNLLRYSTGALPIEGYELEYGKVGTPGALVEDLVNALTAGVEELTRPVDAIKHQAKTVTVGISRSEDALLRTALVQQVLAAGASQDCLSYRGLRTLAELDPAVEKVEGYTRYRIDGGASADATIHVIDRGGVSLGLRSRTESNPLLRGTKHHAAVKREVTVAKGRSDGRTVILVPETKDAQITGMTLLHVRFVDTLSPDLARQVLSGYQNRYVHLSDAVTETEPAFDDERLATIPFIDLLTEPVFVLAERWRNPDPARS
jgi:glucosamine--fructose-6-phosphate aminotransferase (isomerizing)